MAKPASVCRVIPFALTLLIAACGGQAGRTQFPGQPQGERAQLPGVAAAEYTTEPPASGVVVEDVSGVLQSAFEQATRDRGLALIGDARLMQLSAFIADHIAPEGTLPSQAAIDLAARHLGLVEPTPHFVVVGTDAEDGVDARLRDDLVALLDERRYSHYGGVARKRDGISLYVAALVFRFVELAPIPRQLSPGSQIVLTGKLTHGHAGAELAVTEPNGHVVRGEPGAGSALAFRLPARARGVYRVELLGQGPQGITVVANFPVYVGEAPPTSVVLAPAGGAAIDPERASQALLDMINAERAKLKLPALAFDDTLSNVAESHVADMLEHGFVAHTSPSTGSAADRVARAGVRTGVVLENIGRGYSLHEVHEGLMSSPGHRGNILHEQATHVGIGVRATPESGHTAYLVTELFTRVTPQLERDAGAQLLAAINRRRKELGRSALRSEPALVALASRTAARYFASPPPSDEDLMQSVRGELANVKLSVRSVGAVLTVAGSLDELSELDAVVDPKARLIGLGVSQGTRPDTAENAICAVMLLGQ
jgi:hypothetical protein